MAVAPHELGNTPDATVKGCLSFLVALLVVGSLAELLYRYSPNAAYMFVAVVILGYAMTGGNIDKVNDFFASVQGGK